MTFCCEGLDRLLDTEFFNLLRIIYLLHSYLQYSPIVLEHSWSRYSQSAASSRPATIFLKRLFLLNSSSSWLISYFFTFFNWFHAQKWVNIFHEPILSAFLSVNLVCMWICHWSSHHNALISKFIHILLHQNFSWMH